MLAEALPDWSETPLDWDVPLLWVPLVGDVDDLSEASEGVGIGAGLAFANRWGVQ